MKMKLITLIMAFAIPSAFAEGDDCKKDKDCGKKDTVSLVDCGKCEKKCPEGCEKECCKKKEATMLAESDDEGCKKGGCKKESTIA